jgi:TetR/AcrR family transcriptional repressor of mexJK operon
MQPSIPEPGKGSEPGARPDLLARQHFPPPPQQERSRRKRDALLQSALALFAERGYEQTSIEDIAHHAGVAVGGFYQHFASKRQVLLVLMDRLLQEASMLTLEAKSAALPDIRDGIARLLRQALQVDWAYAGAYRAWREAAVRDRELQALHQQIEAWTAQQLTLLFQALLYVPGARQDVDITTLAWEFALLLLRLAEIPLEEPGAVVASLTSLIYHGLFTDNKESP